VARKFASDKGDALGMTKTVVFAAHRREPPVGRPDFPPMKPKKGFTHASREMWDAWISSDANTCPEQVYRSARSLFTSSMVLAVHEGGKCLIQRGYEVLAEHAPIANDIARERLVIQHREAQKQQRPVPTKEMIEKGGKFAALESLMLPQKGGGWCIAVIDIQLLLPIPVADTHVDEIDHSVLQLLYQGFSAKEIGQQVEISHRTVEHRIERMKARIGARTISQLVALSIASGLTGKTPGN